MAMNDAQRRTTGGCKCGAVRFEAVGEPIIVTHCHCNSCRRHTGAPLVTLVSFAADQVRFTKGERRIYASSPGVKRAFCGDCGTTLTWESNPRGQDLIEFHIGTLDDPDRMPPSIHVFHGDRLRWFDTADRLPRYETNRHDHAPYRHAPADDPGDG
jgi:hypothetical protein